MLKRFVFLMIAAFVLGTVANAEVTDKQFSDLMTKYLASESGQQTLGKTMEDYFRKRQAEMQKQQADEQRKRQEKEVDDQFKNPVKIEIGKSPVKGPANAKVTIIEFSDFQCPYCKRGKDTIDQVLAVYPQDVKLAFKHLPLDFHPQALPAAKATFAAQQQGKFWEMHDALFANQSRLGEGEKFYVETAQGLGLNIDKFKSDMNSEAATKQIEADKALAKEHGIQGTPGFFVGGVAVKGAYPIDHFKMIIDRHLGKAAKG